MSGNAQRMIEALKKWNQSRLQEKKLVDMFAQHHKYVNSKKK